jgi:DNA-binding winged helix-turn-helix (wHTH) protein
LLCAGRWVDHPDEVLPYSTFAEALWQSADKRRIRNLNVLVYRLRQKLAASYPFIVKTIRSRGYGLVEAKSPPAESGGREQPAISPAVAAPPLDLLPVGPQRDHHAAHPEPPSALPRAA